MTIKHLYPNSRPTLDLKFAKDKTLDPRITFTRASSGTYVDENGIIQTAASGEARFDHDPVTGESLGLLIEESRTNLFTYGTTLATNWSAANVTLTASAAISPDGTLNAMKVTPTATVSSGHNTRQTVTTTSISTFSVYAKADGYNYLRLWSDQGSAIFNLSDGTYTLIAGPLTAVATLIGNGWYRLTLSGQGATFSQWRFYVYPTSDYATAYAGDGSSGVLLWGAQLEEGSYPTSFIPTTTSTVTRAADVVSLTNTNVYDTDSFTIINKPFGAAAGGSTLNIIGPRVERTTVFPDELTQPIILNLAGKTDEFWRWRVTGGSFGLPNFTTDGQVTVDWGDGIVEVLTTSEHTFADGAGYHEIGFRLDSGTYFRPFINDNASHDTKVVALGPAPESMNLNGDRAFYGCGNLEAFDTTVDATGGTNFQQAWRDCSSLTSFPLIDTSSGTNFNQTWRGCSSLTSFPLIDTSSGTNFLQAWVNCSNLTSFPLIDTSSGTSFSGTWQGCSSLTSFPLIDTSSGTTFQNAWYNCNSLTSFPLIDTSSGTSFYQTWRQCNNLTSFPLLDTSSGTNFAAAWRDCTGLTSFPLIDASSGTNFSEAWFGCTSLTSFPAIDASSGTSFYRAWYNCSSLNSFSAVDVSSGTDFSETWRGCSSLTSFPLIDTSSGTNFGAAWLGCSNLTSFPAINTSSGTNFGAAWEDCSSLTSFPAINTSSGTNFNSAWRDCTGLTSFPLIDTSSGTNFREAWYNCTSLTSFSLIDTSSGTDFFFAWSGCSSLINFPAIDMSSGTIFYAAWYNCSSLTSFPLINTSSGTTFYSAWRDCSSLTTFPANFFDSWTGTPQNDCFRNAWSGCSSLTATSVENILNSIDTSGQSAPASGVDITINYDTGTGTPSVSTAVTNLKSRGWTITLNGVAQ